MAVVKTQEAGKEKANAERAVQEAQLTFMTQPMDR